MEESFHSMVLVLISAVIFGTFVIFVLLWCLRVLWKAYKDRREKSKIFYFEDSKNGAPPDIEALQHRRSDASNSFLL